MTDNKSNLPLWSVNETGDDYTVYSNGTPSSIPKTVIQSVINADLTYSEIIDLIWFHKTITEYPNYRWTTVQELVGFDLSRWKLYVWQDEQWLSISGYDTMEVNASNNYILTSIHHESTQWVAAHRTTEVLIVKLPDKEYASVMASILYSNDPNTPEQKLLRGL